MHSFLVIFSFLLLSYFCVKRCILFCHILGIILKFEESQIFQIVCHQKKSQGNWIQHDSSIKASSFNIYLHYEQTNKEQTKKVYVLTISCVNFIEPLSNPNITTVQKLIAAVTSSDVVSDFLVLIYCRQAAHRRATKLLMPTPQGRRPLPIPSGREGLIYDIRCYRDRASRRGEASRRECVYGVWWG